MTWTLPLGRRALSVELRVTPSSEKAARSGVWPSGGRMRELRPPYATVDRRERAALDTMRAEAFLQLVGRRLG